MRIGASSPVLWGCQLNFNSAVNVFTISKGDIWTTGLCMNSDAQLIKVDIRYTTQVSLYVLILTEFMLTSLRCPVCENVF